MNEDASGQYIDHIGANQDGHFFPEKRFPIHVETVFGSVFCMTFLSKM